MPCWYYEKKELRNTPSLLEGIDSSVEARYRREGARFIIDAGTKLGLRYDTCATGVVYFHRFYMFHSFKEFHRYVTGACCLFLAGKVEETPKKCKDIIKTCRGLLTEQQFSVFGEDPREEVMTLERILLQTIKFDLQVEHPYGKLLYYAKLVKGDKQKIQKLVQMAWTFINDSLCTTLSLQWEPEIISVAMLYLATRLSKLDIQDWVGKQPGTKMKWWEGLLEDLSQDLVEDICHQVLDLYSQKAKAQNREESPPITAAPRQPGVPPPPARRSRPGSPPVDDRQHNPAQPKSARLERESSQTRGSSKERSSDRSSKGQSRTDPPPSSIPYSGAPTTHTATTPSTDPAAQHPSTTYAAPTGHGPPPTAPPGGHQAYQGGDNGYTQFNPYVSSQMYASSFMSQEGSQSIQSLITGGGGSSAQQYEHPGYSQPPPTQQTDYSQHYQASGYQPPAPAYQNHPPPGQPYQQPPPNYTTPAYPSAPGAYPAPIQAPAPYSQPPGQPYPATTTAPLHQQPYTYGQPQPVYTQPPPQGYQYQQHAVSPAVRGPRPRFGGPPGPPRGPPPPQSSQQQQQQQQQAAELNTSTGLATVRITGRRDGASHLYNT